MRFDEVDQVVFEEIARELIEKHGEAVIIDLYQMWRRLISSLCLGHFPIADLHNLIIFENLDEGLKKGQSLFKTAKQISEKHKIGIRTVYSFYEKFYKPRLKMRCPRPDFAHRPNSTEIERLLEENGFDKTLPPQEVIKALLKPRKKSKKKSQSDDFMYLF